MERRMQNKKKEKNRLKWNSFEMEMFGYLPKSNFQELENENI